jgi:hypothetical protein
VQIDPEALPNDPAALQQMLRELYAENDKLRLLIERIHPRKTILPGRVGL